MQPRYPVYTVAGRGNISTIGEGIDTEGRSVNPQIYYDADTEQFRASVEFYGYAQVTYSSRYIILTYTPQRKNWLHLYGFILSYHDGNAATYDVPAKTVQTNPSQELYRVISQYLVSEDGAFEKPVGWPQTQSYPDNNVEPPDEEGTLVHERVHEKGWLSPDGYFEHKETGIST
ncbi:Uncharacterised protein [Candidatus Venteria ishoeyi]|uniref:Uncharacterized protein n=1 Tax=Candidatus Venteria ishoeyi TaxID=1899563 RepID=A0A1H6F8W0_9GAMM|nr:Uncharacterised protein [Candidatus Venteria ishoeyi]